MKQMQPVLKVVVIGGSAVIAINSIWQLTKVKTIADGVMPVITLLVATSAFAYAMAGQEVRVIPAA